VGREGGVDEGAAFPFEISRKCDARTSMYPPPPPPPHGSSSLTRQSPIHRDDIHAERSKVMLRLARWSIRCLLARFDSILANSTIE
jgi:hypothetical protein